MAMAVFRRGNVWWYKFYFARRLVRESAKTRSKTVAKEAEKQRRRELEKGYNNLADNRQDRVRTIGQIASEYLEDYKLRHLSVTFAEYAIRHLKEFFDNLMRVDVSAETVKEYQAFRLKNGAAPKSINEEVGFLLRLLGERGDAIRAKMRREKSLKLKVPRTSGKVYGPSEKAALLTLANIGSSRADDERAFKPRQTRSPFIKPALSLAFNTAMRNREVRNLRWRQIDFEKRFLIVGKSKTDAGEGRPIPLNDELYSVLTQYASWYTHKFGAIKPDWYVFPGRVGKPAEGKKRPYDVTKPISTLKTSWKNLKERAGVSGRFHDTRHTLITELAENDVSDQTIMEIAGHVSRQMLARYSHIRMEAKRKALAGIKTHEGDANAFQKNKPKHRQAAFIRLHSLGHKTGHTRAPGD
jgi:integrase